MGLNEKFFKSASDTPLVPSENFAPVIYTGNGGTHSISTGFATDFVWIKTRSTSNGHVLHDSVRGPTKFLSSNSNGIEGTLTNFFDSFDSNGFTLGSSSNHVSWNKTNDNYVAWCWKAGGAAVLNQEGDIDSQVSANVDAGFSIVTYTGNTTAGATIGHGLDNSPELIFFKRRNATNNWIAVQTIEGVGGYLDLTNAMTTGNYNTWLNNTDPTNTVIELSDRVYINGGDMLAYCFHSVDGYSKIGTYEGTGATNYIDIEFRPSFVMIKNIDTSGTNWVIVDNKRDNADAWLYPNEPDEEYDDAATYTQFYADGFINYSTSSYNNASGATYIYMAFAE
tara:strand:- start:42 stop:1052 length:1011 start_codon:yes stop_codon:yes gene_type:complete